jgi:hypothetical protein
VPLLHTSRWPCSCTSACRNACGTEHVFIQQNMLNAVPVCVFIQATQAAVSQSTYMNVCVHVHLDFPSVQQCALFLLVLDTVCVQASCQACNNHHGSLICT